MKEMCKHKPNNLNKFVNTSQHLGFERSPQAVCYLSCLSPPLTTPYPTLAERGRLHFEME